MNTYGLELIRSDAGDGGWSLHDTSAEPDENDIYPLLLSGEAEWPDAADDWDRPNQADYDAAQARREQSGSGRDAAMKRCYWITFKDQISGETWDEGTPYVGQDEEDAERQMIAQGWNGDPDASIEELRSHYRKSYADANAGEAEAAKPPAYSVYEAEGWVVDSEGLPVRA